MVIYTLQLAKWRVARDQGIELIDITVKSGEVAFAPTWEMVLGIKQGTLSEAEYRKQYIALMRESYHAHTASWEALMGKEAFALGCYCREGHFCHRHILKEMLLWLAHQRHLPCSDGGEIY